MLEQEFLQVLNKGLVEIIISNPREKGEVQKIKLRPVLIKNELCFQSEEFRGTQVFHGNLDKEYACQYLLQKMEGFRQAQLKTESGESTILVSKKGKVTVTRNKKVLPAKKNDLSHNRKKQYLLKEGIAVPFLVDLGVMTEEGKVVKSKYDKYRQINRFVEFIDDILPQLDKNRKLTIIDFGCGKSYLTFALYYYLKVVNQYDIQVIGLDLKKDVISHCNKLSEKYGYDGLKFLHGDIATFDGVTKVDMVVTLHACDTATDFALFKAMQWGADVILSVPCCQHEWNKQLENDLLSPVFQYGLIKERVAALYTDAIRAEILENAGYRTQILEFIDIEHTPKNILIRAVKQGKKKENEEEIEKILEFFHVDPTLWRLVQNKQ